MNLVRKFEGKLEKPNTTFSFISIQTLKPLLRIFLFPSQHCEEKNLFKFLFLFPDKLLLPRKVVHRT